MKVIIAGSRTITDYKTLEKLIRLSHIQITEVVSGCCKIGVDALGLRWAKENKIPIERFSANWNKYGRVAGLIRNTEMARYADHLLALWDGQSNGTKHMIDEAKKYNLTYNILHA